MTITPLELNDWLGQNKVNKSEVFDIIDRLSLDAIPELAWRYEDSYQSVKLLTKLINIMKLEIPKKETITEGAENGLEKT